MPKLLLQALKSIIPSRALLKPLAPSPLPYTTVVAMFPPPPPPSYIDLIGALENHLLGVSSHGTNSRPDLFLPAHAIVLVVAFLVILLGYGENFGRRNRVNRCLTKLPLQDYSAKVAPSKPSPLPSRPLQQAKRVRSTPNLTALSSNDLVLSWIVQNYCMVTRQKHMFGSNQRVMGLDIPDLSEDILELEEWGHHDIPNNINISNN